MKEMTLNILLLVSAITTIAQTNTNTKTQINDTIKAQYPGGKNAWNRYLMRNVNSNIIVKNAAPTGKYVVRVKLLIDTTGNLETVEAQNDPGYGTTQEAVRVVAKGGKWIPATLHGKPITDAFVQTITFISDSAVNAANASIKNLKGLSKKEKDSVFRARDIARLKESIGVNDAVADSIRHIFAIYANKVINRLLDTTIVTDERSLGANILMMEKRENIQHLLTEAQYKLWIKYNMYHTNDELIKGAFIQLILANNLQKEQVKMYIDSLQLTSIQSDSLLFIGKRFITDTKKAGLDSTTTKKEQLVQLLGLLQQKNNSVKNNLTAVQFKRWQQLEMIEWRKKQGQKEPSHIIF